MAHSLVWRYIPPIQANGRVQMAIDQWLLEQHRQGLHPPTLRFYTWSPVTISLGYHQRRYPEFWQQLSWQGEMVELVRRPSGGRAVLHQGDLTYAVITSGLAENRMQAYQQICQFLMAGWQTIGLPLHYGQVGRDYIRNPNCFGMATGADLVTQAGAKVIGSAQLRRGTAILQHGSMQLQPDRNLFYQVFGVTIDPPVILGHLTEAQRQQQIIEALCQAAIECFGIELVSEPLSPLEWQAIVPCQQAFNP